MADGMHLISMSLGSDFGDVTNGNQGTLADSTAVANAVAAGMVVVAANGSLAVTVTVTVTVNATEAALSPPLGVLVSAPDKVSGASQAVLLAAPVAQP